MRNRGVGSWIARRARMDPERLALLHDGEAWTYAELSTAVSRLANVLSGLGVRAGDRVGYLGPNHPAFLQTFFAAGLLGAVFVPLSHRLAAADLVYIVGDAGCDVVVHAAEHSALADEIRAQTAVREWWSWGPATGPAAASTSCSRRRPHTWWTSPSSSRISAC